MEHKETKRFELNFSNIVIIITLVSSIATLSFTAGRILEHQEMQDRIIESQIDWVTGEVEGLRSDEIRREEERQKEIDLKNKIMELSHEVTLLKSKLEN